MLVSNILTAALLALPVLAQEPLAVFIQPVASGSQCLQPAISTSAFSAVGTPVILNACNQNPVFLNNQLLLGYSNVSSLCIGVTTIADGSQLQIVNCDATDVKQQWYYNYFSDKHFALGNTGQCMDLTNGNLTDGNPIQTWSCINGNRNQEWNVAVVSTGTPPASTSTTSTSSTSTSTTSSPTPSSLQIHPKASASKCLAAASDTDGSPVVIDDCSTSSSQAWTVSGRTLRVFGSKCLDVTNGVAANGTPMQIWTCFSGNTNQQWNFSTGSASEIIWSGTNFCFDLTNGNVTDGNRMQIWHCVAGDANQVWTIAN